MGVSPMDIDRIASDMVLDHLACRLAAGFLAFDREHEFTRNEWEEYSHEHPGTGIHPRIVDNTRHPHPEQPGEGSAVGTHAQPVPSKPALPEPVSDDQAYMGAVNSNDMESAQRIVDGAAKKHGFTIDAYHGSPEPGLTKIDGMNTAYGIFLTPDSETADYYAAGDKGRTYHVYLKAENVLDLTDDVERSKFFNEHLGSGNKEWHIFDRNSGEYRKPSRSEVSSAIDDAISDRGADKVCEELGVDGGGVAPDDGLSEVIRDEADEDEVVSYLGGNGYFGKDAREFDPQVNEIESVYGTQDNFYINYQNDVMRAAKNAGHDMVIFDDPSSTGESTSYVVFSPKHIRSADPVMKDDNGTVIPPSKRFSDPDSENLNGLPDENY